ncbi:MAG: ABC transporter ATP-binding protein [Verrucomicrobiota bacterium]|nr:ABC transporter ATP-binding protein [Verrucomicrobiota bacterium]
MEAFVEVIDLSKSYPAPEGEEPVEVFAKLNLSVEKGASVAIVGPSGSGKSSLLNLIGALDKPTHGEIRVGGEELSAMDLSESARYRNQTVGFVFQSHHLLPACTVLENLMVPALAGHGGLSGDALQDRALGLLEEVGLAHRADHRPGEISGGERQRAAVARSLINQPELLLADEPTGALDKENSFKLVDLLADLNEKHGLTLLMVTHSETSASRMQMSYALDDGRLNALSQ